MSSAPETRPNLIIRVRHRTAWHEFVEIYQPVILRLAQHKGMARLPWIDLPFASRTAVGAADGPNSAGSVVMRTGSW